MTRCKFSPGLSVDKSGIQLATRSDPTAEVMEGLAETDVSQWFLDNFEIDLSASLNWFTPKVCIHTGNGGLGF